MIDLEHGPNAPPWSHYNYLYIFLHERNFFKIANSSHLLKTKLYAFINVMNAKTIYFLKILMALSDNNKCIIANFSPSNVLLKKMKK